MAEVQAKQLARAAAALLGVYTRLTSACCMHGSICDGERVWNGDFSLTLPRAGCKEDIEAHVDQKGGMMMSSPHGLINSYLPATTAKATKATTFNLQAISSNHELSMYPKLLYLFIQLTLSALLL